MQGKLDANRKRNELGPQYADFVGIQKEALRILPVEDDNRGNRADEVEQISSMPLVGSLKEHQFVAVHERVMNGSQFICAARSKTMAKRIANALNNHTPNSEGV